MSRKVTRRGLAETFPEALAENIVVAWEVIQGRIDPVVVSTAALNRDRASHHPHDPHVLELEALNELLETFGIEYLEELGIEILNMGDPYVPTLYRTPRGHYRLGCWGDLVERCGRRKGF